MRHAHACLHHSYRLPHTKIILILTFSLLGPVHAEESLNVYIEGVEQSFDASPFIYEGRTLIPARDVSEALGATVVWDATTESVSIFKDDVSVLFIIGASGPIPMLK
jgi:hypothetical protein